MVAFARFVMRDNGLAIHINPDHVTQLRQTIEGDPAVYIAGRDTPMVVEGTLESALRKLEAASAGLKVVETEPPAPFYEPEPLTPEWAKSQIPAITGPASPPVDSLPPPKAKAKAGKDKTPKEAATAKSPKKAATAKAPKKAPLPKENVAPAIPYPAASWFRGAN
ncbi:MAG TPA: hypothetical protein VIJ63_00395 [Roseiarcus sp.]